MNFLLQYKPNKLKIYTKVSEASRYALSVMSIQAAQLSLIISTKSIFIFPLKISQNV